jgi:glycosyltransferase involved in cell wall biosynthesis
MRHGAQIQIGAGSAAKPSVEPLVSIVTPAYNEAEYLAECIESVLRQTYQNWDYTVINNCSTDSTLQIASSYAARDPRIRVVTNDRFLPAIGSHNAAMRRISTASKYCKVVLGDDWLYPECLTRMVAIAEQYPNVGIVGAYVLEGNRVICSGLPYTKTVLSGREVCRRHMLEELYLFGSATSLLFRADLVRSNDPFFNESNIHADTEVCFKILRQSDFAFAHQVLTYTRVRPKSVGAASKALSTDLSGTLQILLTHGAEYLDGGEFAGRLRKHLDAYYDFLAVSVLRRGRDATLWEYHKRKLIETGVGFSRVRVASALLRRMAKTILNLEQLIETSGRGPDRGHGVPRYQPGARLQSTDVRPLL